MKRKIVRIDEDKCNGCGGGVPAGAETAIRIIEGKARLVGDALRDGLRNYPGDCPQDAIAIKALAATRTRRRHADSTAGPEADVRELAS